MKRGRTIRVLLTTLTGAVLLLLMMSLFWLMRHPAGQRLLARAAEQRLGAQLDGSVRIAGLAGDLPWQGNVAAVTLLDDDGAWLTATNLCWQLRPSSWRIWRLPLRFELVGADQLSLLRLPRPRTAAPTPQERSRTLLNFDLLHIDAIGIDPAIHGLPLPARWQLRARGALRSDAIEARVLTRATAGDDPSDRDDWLAGVTVAASLRAGFGAAGMTVTATQAVARLPGLAVRGAVAWRQSAWRLTAQVTATNTPPLLAALAPEAAIAMGAAVADLTVEGGPDGMSAKARFEAHDCASRWARVARLAGDAEMNSDTILFSGLAEGVTNDVLGVARIDDLTVRLELTEIPLLDAVAICGGLQTPWTATESLQFALQAEGGMTNRLFLALDADRTVSRWGFLDTCSGAAQMLQARDGGPDGDLDCRLLRLGAAAGAQRLLLRAPCDIARRAGAWQWDDLEFTAAGGKWHSDGRVARDALAATLSTTNLLAGNLLHCPPALAEAAASLRVWLSGTLAEPRLAAEALLAPVALRRGDGQALPPLTLSAHAGYDGTALSATLDAVGWPWRLLRVTAEAPLRIKLAPWSVRTAADGGQPPWSARLLLAGELEPFNPLLNLGGIHVRGTLEGDLSLAGPLSHPRLGGVLALRDGYAEHPATGTLLRDIRLRAVGEGDRLTLHESGASDGERGSLALTGGLRLPPGAAPVLDVRLQPRHFTLWRAGDSRLAIGGQGSVTGALSGACLTGDFEIVDSRIRLNRARPGITRLPVAGLDEDRDLFFRAEARPPSSWLALDAELFSGKPVSVEGRGLISSWDVSLHIGGTVGAPTLSGGATMREGSLHFMGHRFELAQARVLLDGAVPPMPSFTGAASAEAGGMEAHLRLSGTLAQPRLDLRSTPDLPPEEIVSRLLFGQSSQGISPFQAARLTYGLEVLRGGQPLFDLFDRGQDLIRADALEFTQEDDGEGGALAVGKRLGERVTLRGEKGFGGASDRVLLQVELLPVLILETETGSQMREGVGLRWRLDY